MAEQKNKIELYDLQGNPLAADNLGQNALQNTKLIQRAIDGDMVAFDELYMQSYRYVFFVVRKYVPDDETTYDVIQETFIKVFKNISKLRAPKAYCGWLTTIAKNTAKNFLRSKRPETLITEEEDYSDFLIEDQTQKDVELDVETVLKELDPQDAELLSLVYYDGLRVTQIAKMRDVSAATVYTQLNRAKRKLKEQLAVHGIDRAIYSGSFTAMVTTSIRNIIGTSLLSAAIAQQILDSIKNGKVKKEIAVAKVIKQQQKNHILKIASCIVALSVITSIITVFFMGCFDKNKPTNNGDSFTSGNGIIVSSDDSSLQETQSQQSSKDETVADESLPQQTENNTSQNSSQSVVDNNSHGSSSTNDETQSDQNGNSSENKTSNDDPSDSSNSSNSSNSSSSSNVSSDTKLPTTSEDTDYTAPTYTYRVATAADCYPPAHIPAYPVEDVIVITGVATQASDGVYTVPETIDGKRVGGIMPLAFCDPNISSTVKKVVVPATVRTVWQNAFSNCYNLTDIYLCGNDISIYESAFADLPLRNSKLTIHCSRNCKRLDLYFYRNIYQDYGAEYQEWNGGIIQ